MLTIKTNVVRWLLPVACIMTPLVTRANAQFIIDQYSLVCSVNGATSPCSNKGASVQASYTFSASATCDDCNSNDNRSYHRERRPQHRAE